VKRTAFRARDSYREWSCISSRWADNDLYGHVNNAVYYQWFDSAVNGWLIKSGLLNLTTGTPAGLVVESACRYSRPVSYPEPVEIGLGIQKIGTSSVRYELGVFTAGSDDPAAEGYFIHVYVSRNTRRPEPLSAFWRRALEPLLLAADPA
jgi:acyl-CoA thioester hydrolase